MLEVAIRSADVGGRCTRCTGSRAKAIRRLIYNVRTSRRRMVEGEAPTDWVWERTDDVLTLQELWGYFAAEKVGKPAKNGGDLTL